MLLDEQFQQPGAGSLCSLYEKGLKTLTSQGGEGRRGKEERTRNQHKLERIGMIRKHTDCFSFDFPTPWLPHPVITLKIWTAKVEK